MKKGLRLPYRALFISALFIIILVTALSLQAMLWKDSTPIVNAQGTHDVAIISVIVSKRTVVKGESVYIYVTAENQGYYTETFDVSVFADKTPISLPQTVNSLPSNASQNLAFTWETAGFSEGSYRIKAQASIVLGEVDITDNTLTDGTVSVRLTSCIGTSGFYLGTNLPFQRKSFHASGLHWVFYSDYKNIVYRTSSDGIAWGSPVAIREALYGYLFSLWLDGTYVHYAYTDSSTVLHRRGTISGESITWGMEHVVVTGGDFWSPNICVDSNGYPWITYRTNNLATPTNTRPYIVKAATTDGSIWGTPKQLSTLDELWWITPLPLASGKVYVLYSYPHGPVYGDFWNGNSWLTTPEMATPDGSATGDFGCFSAVAKGDNVYVVYLQNFTRNIVTLNRTSGLWGQESTIVTFEGGLIFPEPPDPSPTISIDPSKGNLYVRWIGFDLTLALKVRQIRYDATLKEWSGIEAPFGTIFTSPDARSLSSYYQVWDSTVGSTWMEGTSFPYSVTYSSQRV